MNSVQYEIRPKNFGKNNTGRIGMKPGIQIIKLNLNNFSPENASAAGFYF